MTEMLQRRITSPVRVIVDNDPLFVTIMKSDMARALPHVALKMVENIRSNQQSGAE